MGRVGWKSEVQCFRRQRCSLIDKAIWMHLLQPIRRWSLVVNGWLCLAIPSVVIAAPTLTVTSQGANGGGNLEWLVEVTPDPTLFSLTDLGLGSSLAVELAFEVSNTDLLSVSVNATDWPLDTAGENPFTGTVTTGVNLDLAGDTLYASLLSDFFTAGNPVEVLTLETSGSGCTSVAWGGHTIFGGTADEYETSLIAQNGQNFTGYQGTAGEPAGDFDEDCDVDGADLLEWQQGVGTSYDASDLADWHTNYGAKGPLQASISTVPEPATSCAVIAMVLTIVVRRALVECRTEMRLYL